MINKKMVSKFLLAGSAFVVSANVFGTQSVSANGYFVFSLDDLYKWLASLFRIVQNSDSSSKVNEPVNFVDEAKNILGEEAKWSFDENSNRYTAKLQISLVGDFVVSLEPNAQKSWKCYIKSIKDNHTEVVKEFDIGSEKEVSAVKEYFEQRVSRSRELWKVISKYDFFRLSKKSPGILCFVLPNNLKINLDSNDGKEYVVSGIQYDFESQLLSVFSSNYESGCKPFLVCSNLQEVDTLFEKISNQRREFDYNLITKVKEKLEDVVAGEKWSYCEKENKYSVPLRVEDLTIPIYIRPMLLGGGETPCCGYGVGYNNVSGHFFNGVNSDEDVVKKFIEARENFAYFVKIFKDLEKTGKFDNIQISDDGLTIEARENISVRSKFVYTRPKDMEGVTQRALANGEHPYLLKRINYASNCSLISVEFDKYNIDFDLEEDNDRKLFNDFVGNLLSDALNENVENDSRISQTFESNF